MQKINRRSFLGYAAAGAAVAGTQFTSTRSYGRVLGANDTVNVAVVGIHGRGSSHISEFGRLDKVRLAALCDVDQKVLDGRAEKMEGVKKYQDVRRLLENKDIDVVSVATTNHWHSLITIWACQAGKDVYVEKPCSHNVFEGRKCVEAARKYQRIVQHGTQSRASSASAKLAALVHSGVYGKLLVSKGYCGKARWSIGYKPIQSPPPNLNFDLWLGPAPQQPYHENLVHYNWHWFWDFGNGDMGNQGVHEIDKARWYSGGALPRSVVSVGGRWVEGPDFRDQGQTPNQILSIFDYGDYLVVFETRGLVGKIKEYPPRVDNELYFEQGVVRANKFHPNGQAEGQPLADVKFKLQPGGIFGNFIQCVRNRKVEELNADIEQAHLSSALCHLGNISYRMGSPGKFAPPPALGDNQVVGESIMTLLENTKAIGVDPEKTILWTGPKLAFDPVKEKFVGNPAADQLLTRAYRPPYVVPDVV